MSLFPSFFGKKSSIKKDNNQSVKRYKLPSKKQKIVIIGGVAGGASCAARLRRQDEHSEIIIFERGSTVSFANCGLPYYIGDVIKEETDLFLADPLLFRERFNVTVRVQHTVLSIDCMKKTIQVLNQKTNSQLTESYDKLVLAPGAAPIKPPFPGLNLEGIFSLRDVPDSNKIKQWIAKTKAKKAIVIGGGFIGLEMVENFRHLGIEVTLIERDKQILAPLDEEMTATAMQILRNHNVTLMLNSTVQGFSRINGNLQVDVKGGGAIQADIIILSIGVRPESDLAKEAGIDLTEQGHIIVNDEMQTSEPSIYAVGDAVAVQCAICKDQTALPLAGPANRQGRIAADVISGNPRSFRGVQGTAICGLFSLTMATTGLNEKTLLAKNMPYHIVFAYPNDHVSYYPGAKPMQLKMLFNPVNGQIYGAQAVGECDVERRIDVIAMAIQMRATVFDLEESELCYAPQYGAAKDPVNILGMIGANMMRGALKSVTWPVLKKDSYVLDIRDKDEVEKFSIPCQTHIPLNELRDRLHELPKDQTIFVACAVGLRANIAVRLLNQHEFKATLISGGVNAFMQYKLFNHYQ